MRSYCALYVDVGYLLAAAATRVTGTSLRRSVVVSYPDLIKRLIEQAERESGLPLLRVNWYDSAGKPGGGRDSTQVTIGMLPRVKLRLGRISPQGEQKGVDLRIGLDLAAHGRTGAVDVMYLVSGDDDLSEAVEEAQTCGAQVVVMAIPNVSGQPHAVSGHLIQESDGVIVVDGSIIDETVWQRQLQRDGATESSPAVSELEVTTPASAEIVPELPGVDLPARPTPAALARLRPPSSPIPTPSNRVVWSSSSGADVNVRPATSPEEDEAIAEVVRRVIAAWRQLVTPADVALVGSERPFIPKDLDRSLLIDLAARLGEDDISDTVRHTLRAQFWTEFDRTSST